MAQTAIATNSAGVTVGSFRTRTSRGFVQQQNYLFSGAGNTDFIPLTRTGWLAAVYGVMTVTVTTGSAGTYTIGSNNGIPSPFSFLRRITLESNNGFQLRAYDGWSNYLEQTIERNGNVLSPGNSYKATNTQAAIYSVPTTFTTSTTYTFNIPIYINVVYSRAMPSMMGLVLLNSDNSTMYLRCTWGQGTDLVSTTGGTVTVNSVTFQPSCEIYNQPEPVADGKGGYVQINPGYGFVKQIVTTTDNTGISAGGFYQPTNPPYGGSLLYAAQTYINNGALMVPANFGNVNTLFNSTLQPESETFANHLLRMRRLYDQQDFPDGVLLRNYNDSSDMIDLPNLDNAIPTTDTTSLTFQTYITAGTTLTNPQVNNMWAFLRSLNSPAG